MRGSGGRKIPLPPARLALFLGQDGLLPPVFAGGVRTDRKTVAERFGGYARVEIFNRAWQAFETLLAVWRGFSYLGRARRAAFCSPLRVSQGRDGAGGNSRKGTSPDAENAETASGEAGKRVPDSFPENTITISPEFRFASQKISHV